jgi:hypothetical protein
MITEVRNKIYSLGSAITGLSGRFYYLEAPQGVAKPYAVFSLIANPTSRDTASRFEEIYFQINLYGDSLSTLETIENLTKQKFDDSESDISLTAYHCDRIERELTRNAKYDTVFQITIQYKLELTKL